MTTLPPPAGLDAEQAAPPDRSRASGALRGPHHGPLYSPPHSPRRGPLRALPSGRSLAAAAQWAVTLGLCAFLIIPIGMSVLAGLTVYYFRGP